MLAFVEEDIDPTGPFGSFILTVLLAVATLERDNMVAGWTTTKARATERGAKIGPTPFGNTWKSAVRAEPNSAPATWHGTDPTDGPRGPVGSWVGHPSITRSA
jgi:DNA invertase Pin-like site-specific DNA recombinase